jgi:hypothetical protein
MAYRPPQFVTMASTATVVSSTATARTVALPTTADGTRARYIYVSSDNEAFIRPTADTVTTVTNGTGLLLTRYHALHLDVTGFTNLAHVQSSTTTNISIVPLEVG